MSELNKNALELSDFLDDCSDQDAGIVRDLVAENERLAKDAMRYRDLFFRMDSSDLASLVVKTMNIPSVEMINERVDAAIDAMREGGVE